MAVAPDRPLDLLPRSAVIAVAMSGGVDSSVAAARVAATSLRAFGITLAMWPGSREAVRDRGCCSIDAVDDARRVATALDLPHYVWNLERDFESAVVRSFEDGYANGTTPNPCITCNQRIKFGVLLERARAAGATHLATGHYARVGRRGSLLTLHRAHDARRDQAYVLHRLDQRQLQSAVFALGGDESKAGVRAEATALGLGTAGKPDSQDLCFVNSDLRSELRLRLDGRFAPGAITDADGAVLGKHEGLPFFTVGQRAGLGIPPARPDAAPRYVIELLPEANAVVVGPRDALRRSSVEASSFSWVAGCAPPAGTGCEAQLRAHGHPHPARIERCDHEVVSVRFDTPVDQAAPGQSLVLYRGDEVLGGGIIRRAA
ncbi:MAG TPA: tRNA 2-thiouridine(34) synthase MnmA [Candidatus Saccharimonadales bacterium]|nr:tRNA 2-thiouridine(34) synthase MnmA [Candidatus Saccharimonadales bacterium]